MKKLITMAIIGFVAATTAPLANAAGTDAGGKPVPTPRPEKRAARRLSVRKGTTA